MILPFEYLTPILSGIQMVNVLDSYHGIFLVDAVAIDEDELLDVEGTLVSAEALVAEGAAAVVSDGIGPVLTV